MKTYTVFIIACLLVVYSGYAQQNTFKRYKAFNGITFEYNVLLPKNFESDKAYKTIVSFAGVETKDDVSEEINEAEEESDEIREEMKDLENEMDELLEDL